MKSRRISDGLLSNQQPRASAVQPGHSDDKPLKSERCAAVASPVVGTYFRSGEQAHVGLGTSSVLRGVLVNRVFDVIVRGPHILMEAVDLNPSRLNPGAVAVNSIKIELVLFVLRSGPVR